MPKVNYVQPCGASDVTITFPSTSGTLALSGAGLTGFIPSQNTAAPNNTVNASRLLVDATSTNADIVLQPKGTGAFLAQLPDSTTTGGNKRGARAVDLQMQRGSAGQAALGTNSVITGGANNIADAQYCYVGGGFNNYSGTNQGTVVVGGTSNLSYGVASFVGGGASNSVSQNYSNVVGGISNQVTSPFASILGGNSNVLACDYGVIAGGQSNNANSATHSAILCGFSNVVAANYASVINGYTNTVYGNYSTVLNGFNNVANNDYCVIGGRGSTTRTVYQKSYSSYRRAFNGDTQQATYHLVALTTNGTPTVMTAGLGAVASTNLINIPAGSTLTYKIIIACRQVGGTNLGAWEITGVADNTAGTITLYNSTVNLIHRTVGTWTTIAVADSTNQSVNIQVTGSGTTVLWSATVNTIIAYA
jgi:hypothetical protein